MDITLKCAMDDLMTFNDIAKFPHHVSLRMTWEDQHRLYESIDQWIAEMKPDYRASGLFWIEQDKTLESIFAFKDLAVATLFKLRWA